MAETPEIKKYGFEKVLGTEKLKNEFIIKVALGKTEEKLSVSFPYENGIRFHGTTGGYFLPKGLYDIEYTENPDGSLSLSSENGTKAVFFLNETPWRAEVYNRQGGKVTEFSADGMSYGFSESGDIAEVSVAGNMGKDAVVYGLGERFNSFNRRGISTYLRNNDAWSTEDTSYKSIPLIHSSDGFTFFFDSAFMGTADIGVTSPDKFIFTMLGNRFDFFVYTDSPLQNLNSYCQLTGASVLAPRWALRYIPGAATLSWGECGSGNLPKLKKCMDGYKKLGIYDIGSIYGETGFNEDPEAYALLKETGTRMLNWMNPFYNVGQMKACMPDRDDTPETLQLPALRKADNLHEWAEANQLDYSNPAAKTFIKKFFKYQVENAYGFMLDFGEYYNAGTVAYNGFCSDEMHNLCVYYYHKAYHSVMNELCGGKGDFLFFTRNAAIGSQRYACQMRGDQTGDFAGLKKAVIAALSLDTCGFSLAGSDIGGLGGTCGPEVYRRWLQFATFEGLMRVHGTDEYEDPWCEGDELSVINFLDAYWFRENMLLKNYSSNIESHLYGKPITEAMALAFPEYKPTLACDDEFIFSDDFLVAPVSDSGVYHRKADLPDGNWTDIRTGKVYKGGKAYDMDAPQDYIPVLLRQGSAFPVTVSGETLSLFDSMSDGKREKAVMITAPNGTRITEYYETPDNKTVFINGGSGNKVTVTASVPQSAHVIIAQGMNASAVTVDGKPLEKLTALPENNEGYFTDGRRRTVIRVNFDWQKAEITLDKCLDTDYALGKTVSGNFENASAVTDPNAETSAKAENVNGAYLTVDLGKTEEINEITVKWNNFDEKTLFWIEKGVNGVPIAPNVYSVDYDVSVSADGENFVSVASVFGDYNTVDTVKFEKVSARFVKISVLSAYPCEEYVNIALQSVEKDKIADVFEPSVYRIEVFGDRANGTEIDLSPIADLTGGYEKRIIDNDGILTVKELEVGEDIYENADN